MKIVHVHTGIKFAYESLYYNDERIENQLIILGDKNKFNREYHRKAIFLDAKKENVPLILKLCVDADLVVLNDLDLFKCKIALALPKSTKIAWRFWGYELYSRKLDQVLSKRTQLILQSVKKNHNLRSTLNSTIQQFYSTKLLQFALKRINFFFGIYKEEYENLKLEWPLPPFVNFLVIPEKIVHKVNHKESYIIVGNNRSIYNNHIDIIEIISNSKNLHNYVAKFFFNYGELSDYSSIISNSVKNHRAMEIIGDFQTVDKFEALYKNASAFVMNGYRQMALNNIFIALKNGVKVYLNPKNDTFNWLVKNGFIIYSIDEFSDDFEKGNLKLCEEIMEHNINCINRLYEQNSPEMFCKRLSQILL
jgi:dTDP-N-acetylfucosamine:lipid II N-acetylfucosaminyltransferase